MYTEQLNWDTFVYVFITLDKDKSRHTVTITVNSTQKYVEVDK